MWIAAADAALVGADFTSDLGFVPRKDFIRSVLRVQRFGYPRRRAVLNRYSLEAVLLNVHHPSLDYRYTDFERRLTGALGFTDQSTASLEVAHDFIYLAEAFDPPREGDAEPLPGDAHYRFWDAAAERPDRSVERRVGDGPTWSPRFRSVNLKLSYWLDL